MVKDISKNDFPSEEEQQARPYLYIISGTMPGEEKGTQSVPFWALVEVPAEKSEDFVNAYLDAHNGDCELELSHYVTNILDSARGEKRPSKEKMAELKETYGDRLNVLKTEEPGERTVIPGDPANDI